MRILHIIPTLGQGGAERLVLDICNELQSRPDVDIKLVILHPINDYKKLSENLEIEVCESYISPSIFRNTNVNVSSFEKIVNEFQPNVIHSHLFEAELISRWKTYPKIKYFTHCHDNIEQFQKPKLKTFFFKSKTTNFYERTLLFNKYRLCSNQFIAISKHSEKYLKKHLPKSIKNIHYLPNAINFNLFFNSNKRQLIGSPIRLINVGSFVDKKNQLFLIDVVNILEKKGIDVRLTLCGDGINRFKIESAILANNLNKIIVLPGKAQNVQDFYAQADIYVHSAVYETFGLVILEAMAAGLPVVTLDGGGNRDIIEDGKNGFLMESQNPELFADRIIELIENQALYARMSEYAKEFARESDIEPYVEKLINLYQNSGKK